MKIFEMAGGLAGHERVRAFGRGVAVICRMIKIEHSVFALPFAYIGAWLAAGGWPGWRPFLLLSVAMVAVRSYSMTMNRILDLAYDRQNLRTQGRPLVTGEVGLVPAWLFALVMAGIFVLACWGMNRLALLLSPVPLVWAAFYSLTKRFTPLCHYVLGSVLGLAPLAGWLAYAGEFSFAATLYGLGVTFWVAGFDILYAAQDERFDRTAGLHSMPADFGLPKALALSTFSHVNASLFFLLGGWAVGGSAGLTWPYYAVWGAVSFILLYQHRLIRPDDLSRVNMAFFTMNGIVAVFVFVGVLLGIYVR
jgi:4-hydroxybenzoate polyprenyltransferase